MFLSKRLDSIPLNFILAEEIIPVLKQILDDSSFFVYRHQTRRIRLLPKAVEKIAFT